MRSCAASASKSHNWCVGGGVRCRLLPNVCAGAIADGLTSCVVFDACCGEIRAGVDHGGVASVAPLLDLLTGSVPVAGADRSAFDRGAREALIVGSQHTAFACVTSSRKWL